MNYWPLLGIALVVIGFALRFNPLLVVVGAAVATGLLAGLDIVAVVEALGRAFGVSKLPYAVLIDEQQRVASLGIVNSREHIDSLFEAKERGVASIQDYMNKRVETPFVEVKS